MDITLDQNEIKTWFKSHNAPYIETFSLIPNVLQISIPYCSIRRRSRLVAAYNSIAELNKIVDALE